ncbi:MAG TPA: hypothetical protein VK152_09050 [Paludibacter sp.]|nr:hypothetical protein [Paludibacter sp.]
MLKNISCLTIVAVFLLLASCNPTPDYQDSLLDSGQVSYAIPDSLHKHLVSEYLSSPTEAQKNTPVVIAAHGYTATTFEWDEFREFADARGTFHVSQVLLGGHGRSYPEFKKASWRDWQSSIVDEYRKLDSIGYKKIYLAGSSTGAPLILKLVRSGFFNQFSIKPKGIFLVDPIVVSSNKTLTLVGLLGPVLGYTSVELSPGEVGHWYVYRPQETLKELMELINIVRLDLQKGIRLPAGTQMKVYKSITDDVADPVSALMIYKGVRTSNGNNIDVKMVESKLHVFTRLRGREGVTAADIQLQQATFAEMATVVQ